MSSRPRVDALIWDDWNLDHIAKHGVTRIEAEEVVKGNAMFVDSYKNRIAATGATSTGRMLTIVIGESPHQRYYYYYPFSARPASRKERRDYANWSGSSRT